MKLPSIQQVVQDSGRTFLRFPFVLINAVIGTVTAVILIDHEGPPQATILFNILLATILGIPLLTALALLAEKKKWGKSLALGAQLIGVLLLVAYAYTVPMDLGNAPAIHILRLLFIAVALHLFVAFAPFMAAGEYNGFWHYNKTLLLRLVTSGLYALVLYAGLALALAALNNLFGMNVPPKRYAELWFGIIGLFTTWFFLAGIPEDLDSLENSTDYPQGIKVFAQYILLPLVLVYLVILYAYLLKIIIAWNWPQGWVSKLILGFSATGIFSLLLLYPIRDRVENIWIRTISRWFYIVMVPLILMLFPAVWRRISEYGITEGRYIAVALSIWLAGIVVYYILSKTKSIKLIPASLCVLALIISFGPWGAFDVSERSQVNRLKVLLMKNSILADGMVRQAPVTVSGEDAKQISSIIAYLHDIHGYDRIQPWFRETLREDSTGKRLEYKAPDLVSKMMGVRYINIWYGSAENDIRLSSNQGEVIDVRGYDRMLRAQHVDSDRLIKVFTDQDISYRVDSSLYIVTFTLMSERKIIDSLQIDLHPLMDRLLEAYRDINVSNIPPENMSLSNASQNMKIKVYFRSIHFNREEKEVKLIDYVTDILYSFERIDKSLKEN